MLVQHIGRMVNHSIYIRFRQAVNLAEFTDDASVAEGTHSPHKCRVFPAISLEDVIVNIVTLIPTKINIKVRRGLSLWVQKPLKVKVKFNRADVGYLEAIGNDTVCPAAAPHMVKAPRHRIAHNV